MMKLFIEQDFQNYTVNFFLRYHESGREVFIGIDKNKMVEYRRDDLTAPPVNMKPLLSLPHNIADEFIKQIAQYASGKGIQTENENLLKGKLEATEKHLEDMRIAFGKLINV